MGGASWHPGLRAHAWRNRVGQMCLQLKFSDELRVHAKCICGSSWAQLQPWNMCSLGLETPTTLSTADLVLRTWWQLKLDPWICCFVFLVFFITNLIDISMWGEYWKSKVVLYPCPTLMTRDNFLFIFQTLHLFFFTWNDRAVNAEGCQETFLRGLSANPNCSPSLRPINQLSNPGTHICPLQFKAKINE